MVIYFIYMDTNVDVLNQSLKIHKIKTFRLYNLNSAWFFVAKPWLVCP